MNCDTVSTNWLTAFKAKVSCDTWTTHELMSAEIGLAIEALLAKCATIITDTYATSGCNINTFLRLDVIYNKITCGKFVSEREYYWAKAELARLEKLCTETTDARLALLLGGAGYVFARGIHSWNDGASTSGDIPITGLLTTDVVVATLHSQAAAELLVKAVTAAGQINVTLSANGTDTTTKINYVVIRPISGT